jgi:predicted unusual protein kinase regulating ubiquinone biosynthesis (AarF/ABC1/UbiB family)
MRRRYWRILLTQLHIVIHIFVFDILLGRWYRASTARRWQRLAVRFRALAIDLGGVPIKMGQFLSVRVDILPPEVTQELAGLRDDVPAVPYSQVEPLLTAAWGNDPSAVVTFGIVAALLIVCAQRLLDREQRRQHVGRRCDQVGG